MTPLTNKPATTSKNNSVWRRFSLPMHTIARWSQQELEVTKSADNQIKPEQVLMGITSMESCNGYRLLKMAGADPRIISAHVATSVPSLSWPPPPMIVSGSTATIHLSPEFARIINASAALAKQFGHLRVGTEHFLLALLSDSDSIASAALINAGVSVDACRDAFGKWLMSGDYQLEPAQSTDPSVQQATSGRMKIGLVYKLRQWAQMAYVIGIVGLFFSRYISPGFGGPVVSTALDMVMVPLMFFIWPYFFSTYALGYLLRTRAERSLVGKPIGAQFQSMGLQFALSILTGLIIAAGTIAGSILVGVSAGRWLGSGPEALIGVGIAVVMEVIVWVLMTTHWLLTFDIRGTAV